MNHRTIFAIVLSLAASLAHADGLQDLETFLREVKSAQASFTQVVTSPKREGEATARSKTSSGRFEFQRPGRFRFEYTKPFEQTIVADGQTLWLYDVDLNQVTARKQQDALGSTPAALIASGTDIKGLSEAFDLKAGAARDGMEWVDAQPKAKDGQLQSVKVGFRQGQLAVLEIVDGLGQRSVLSFAQWQGNVAVKPERFRFQPPAGADVIRP
ncbi:outer membrane lipoprotein chaperone LolA [Hydrogenophaga pseudoflava]|jgi:outer membrane lipoprotein carrier protein|uniref:Outer-membrane lipoprotein carrier protein n=1 Tax=Hydrogenophaga pseudoflava TaxID=47421 RepID=A0A4P6X4J9_HYDPS|nr:outer membrane lipoprotein chaperone LolA [Hydrogenophaga pseudoflava]QBM29785.1 Outer-membrane lipoprotein carrier protein precursor [Hydrogenophaga pseudoflava]